MRRARLIIPRDDISSEVVPANELVVDINTGALSIGDGVTAGNTLPKLNKSKTVVETATSSSTTICTITTQVETMGLIRIYLTGGAIHNGDVGVSKIITVFYQNSTVHGLSIINQQTDYSLVWLGTGSFTPTITVTVSSGNIVVNFSGDATPVRWSVSYDLTFTTFDNV